MSHHALHSPYKPNTGTSDSKEGLKLFLSFFWRNPGLMTIAIIFLIVNTFLTLIPAVLIARALDILLNQGYGSEFLKIASLMLVVALANYIATLLSSYSFTITAFAMERDVRKEFFDAVVDSSLAFHDKNNSSNLLSLGLNEAHIMSAGAMMLRTILQSAISMIIVLFYFNSIYRPVLTISVTIGFLLYFIMSFQYAEKIVPVRRDRSVSLAELTEESQEIFRGIQVVKSFSSQKRELDRFKGTSAKNATMTRKEGQFRAFYLPALLLIIITIAVFGYSLALVRDNTLSIQVLIEAVGLLLTIQLLNLQLPTILLGVRGSLINAERIADKITVAKEMKKQESRKNNSLESKPISKIHFDDVTFAYPSTFKAVIKQITLTVRAGEKIVLLGGPGSGKSSLMKLILGLYTPQHGHIYVNDKDLRDLDELELRQNIAMVEQDVFLFAGTIRENVSFANPYASEDEINLALQDAQAMEFVSKLDKGIDTVIGERGVTLSGGQKQRLAIARALLSNPQILLLDDSTSAVDPKTESLISKAIENLSQNRTTINVAQRLNILVEADKIIFLEKGSMIGYGSHKELYASNEKYRRIFDLLPDSTNDRNKNVQADLIAGGK